MAPRFRASSRVPDLGAGNDAEQIAFDADGAMIVFDGASDATIYEDAAVNHAFRAWHDACHIERRLGFTLAAEREVCELQIVQALQRYPNIPARVLRLIRAEVTGQAEHFAVYGQFPIDQAAFIRRYIGE